MISKISSDILEKLEDLAKKKLVKIAECGNLRLYKYSRKAFYTGAFEQYTVLNYARGLVVDDENNIIANPFTKVFNYEEFGAGIGREDDFGTAVEKINGSLGVVSRHRGQIICSTTGSLNAKTSEFVARLQTLIKPWEPQIHKVFNHLAQGGVDYTLLFEVCVPEDKHIVDEETGLYLIGIRGNDSCDSLLLPEPEVTSIANKFLSQTPVLACSIFRPQVWEGITLSQAINFIESENAVNEPREGIVFYFNDGEALKYKTKTYRTHKFFARAGEKKLWQVWSCIDRMRRVTDEDLYPILDALASNFSSYDDWNQLSEQEKLEFIRGV